MYNGIVNKVKQPLFTNGSNEKSLQDFFIETF